MNSSLHLKVLALILFLVGSGITAYQIFVLKIPLKENKIGDVWTVDARIGFYVSSNKPVEVTFRLPPTAGNFDIANELFVANGYGQTMFDNGTDRVVNWTARRVNGQQTIFYRINLARKAVEEVEPKGVTWCLPIPAEGADKVAIDVILEEVRQKSSDTISFITMAVNKINDPSDSNVRLLLKSDNSIQSKVRVLELVLSHAHIPVEVLHTLRLYEGVQAPEMWIRSYIEVTRSGEADWYYFNFASVSKGLPKDRFIWWVGNVPLIESVNTTRVGVDFTIDKNELSIRSLARLSESDDFSLYSLPLTTQYAYKLMLMIPFGVFIILLMRNIVGIETLGTFTPVLIALAFRETGLVYGIVFFAIIVSVGLFLRSYLEHLKLQMLPRLSVVLTAVIMLIITCSMLSHKLGFDKGLAITLFPMVILTMAIERLSITWEERGGSYAFRVAIGTLIAASVVFVVLNISSLTYFVFTFPASLLVLMVLMLGIGRYRGYRITELFRFKALINRG